MVMEMQAQGIDRQLIRNVIASLGFSADRVERAVDCLVRSDCGQESGSVGKLLSSEEVQRLLGVSKSTLRRMIDRKELRPVHITPRRIGFKSADIQAFVESLRAS